MADQVKTVFVGLSGGVDSSVTALRLKNAGYNVVGVFIKVWHPDFLICDWKKERLDAMRVAAKLDIPFLTCDAQEAYKNDVAEYFINEYKAGRTPNPDVMCNKFIKFGRFFEFAKEKGADFIATGHYAQIKETSDCYELHRGVDNSKDQSYFLWTLNREQLSQILFPIGNSTKTEIRKEAANAGLLTARKQDSQGICFLGHVDIPEFLSHYTNLEKGLVLDEDSNEIGTHKGAFVYTTGQRHGFNINSKNETRTPYFVKERNIEKNILIVTNIKPLLPSSKSINLINLNLIADPTVALDKVEIQTRYRQKPVLCRVTHLDEISMSLIPESELEAPSIGQSCVLYQGIRCLGGGIIN